MLVLGGALLASPGAASAEWVNEGPAGMEWYNNGNPSGRFMSYSEYNAMLQRAAAGGISGGGAIPKGFTKAIVESGEETWKGLQSTTASGVKGTAWRELKSATLFFTQDLKAAPLLTKLSAVTLGLSAFELGWKIGGGEGSIWGFDFGGKEEETHYTEGGPYTFTAKELYPVPAGESLAATESVALSQPVFQVYFSVPPFADTFGFGGYESTGECSPPILKGPAGMVTLKAGPKISECPKDESSYAYGVAYTTAPVTCIAGQTSEGCATREYGTTREESMPTPLEGEAATEAAADCFEGVHNCEPFPAWWFNHDPEAQEKSTVDEGVGGGLVIDPLSTVIPKPGKTEQWPDYVERLEELELVPDPQELDFSERDEEREQGTVIFTKPNWGTQVEPESTVEVHYNPEWRVVPQINEGETYKEYAARIESETGLKPQSVPLPEWATDPTTGPEGASYTVPAEGTSVKPGSEVKVQTNPTDAPYPPSSSWSPPGIASVDMSPFGGVDPCGVFPFGLFCWVGGAFTEIGDAAADCPEFNPHLPAITGGEESAEVGLCSGAALTVREVMRMVELFVFVIGIGLLFAKATRVFGPGD